MQWAGDVFGIPMSLGTVNKLKKEASSALEEIVEVAKIHVQHSPVVGADETHFNQGNVDGCNHSKKQGWLWVAVTPLVAIFEIALSRGSDIAKNLLGEDFSGTLNSDRYAAYNWVNLEQRQLCWAHLKREFIKISERFGVSGDIGKNARQTTRKIISTMAPGSRWNFESS